MFVNLFYLDTIIAPMESLELNLYNFEDEENAGSRYVLTSPRSLQSCDMLGVKVLSLQYYLSMFL